MGCHLAIRVPRLDRKPSGTFYLRILLGSQASTSGGECRKRAEVRRSLGTKDRDLAVAIASRVNALLKLARSMTDRKALLDALGGDIRTWTIGPDGITAEPGKDTDSLLQALRANPDLLTAVQPRSPSIGDLRQLMQDTIQNKLVELQAARGAEQAVAQTSDSPQNPLRFVYFDGSLRRVGQLKSRCGSRRFGEYLDTLDIRARDLVFHSFRHTVVSALQDGNVPLADAMQITGHQAQEHAVATGRMSVAQAQSVHIKTYVHSDKARLNVEYPLARLKGHLDRLNIGIDYTALRRAADIVREKTVRTAAGFESGWSSLGAEHEQLMSRASL